MRKTKKIIISLLVALVLVFSGCKDNSKLKDIELSRYVLELSIGDVHILEASLIPDNAYQGELVWSSSDEQVATVLQGIVTAVSEGNATITVEAGAQAASCLILVSPAPGGNMKPGENVDNAVRLHRSPKRGVSFSFSLQEDVNLLKSAVSWSYNWGTAPSAAMNTLFNQSDMDFYPMAWNGGFDSNRIRSYKNDNPQCDYILAFNEPNLTDQCNYTPEQAAAQWGRLRDLADELDMKLISPAMNYGTLAGYSDPIKWLDEFFELVPLSDVDGIAVHSYMPQAGAVKSFLDRFRKYNKPLWLTEFCAWDGGGVSPGSQMNYMSEIINYMEADPTIERYAWFIPRASGPVDSYPYMQLLTKTQPFELTPLGRVFVGISSQDKTTWQHTENFILAQTYSSVSTSESVSGAFVPGPHLRPTTDTSGDLEVCDFFTNNWVEYQVDVPETTHKIRLRYSNFAKSECSISVDGRHVKDIELPSTTDPSIWNTVENELKLDEGKQTVRITVKQGNICLNWLKFD